MHRLRAVLVGALVLGSACAKSTKPSNGTNTNWLTTCTAPADCGGDGECLCGVCTRSCSGDASCSELGEGIGCASLTEATCGALATASAAGASACLPECRRAADCDAIDDGVCREGHCVPEQPPSGDAGSGQPGPGDAGFELTRVDATVLIPDTYRACGNDVDCILVGTSCDGCCEQDAINAAQRATYDVELEQACRDYMGGMCDCGFADLLPRCEDGLCTALRVDAQTCYSPTQNLDRAYELDALGCLCPQAGLSICVGGAALICGQFRAERLAWTAVVDGPCEEPVTECGERAQRTSATACLAEFATCVELPSGAFCGSNCHTLLNCAAGACEYAPFEGCDGFPQTFEGTCGAIRWRRAVSRSSTTWYWNDAGELLARVETSDIPEYCGGGDNVLLRGDLTVVQTCAIITDDTTRICP